MYVIDMCTLNLGYIKNQHIWNEHRVRHDYLFLDKGNGIIYNNKPEW